MEEVEGSEDEENKLKTIPIADSNDPEFSPVPKTGDNSVTTVGDEEELRKIEEEEAKRNENLTNNSEDSSEE